MRVWINQLSQQPNSDILKSKMPTPCHACASVGGIEQSSRIARWGHALFDWRLPVMRGCVLLAIAGSAQGQDTVPLGNSGAQAFAFSPTDHFLYASQQGPGSARLNVINWASCSKLSRVFV